MVSFVPFRYLPLSVLVVNTLAVVLPAAIAAAVAALVWVFGLSEVVLPFPPAGLARPLFLGFFVLAASAACSSPAGGALASPACAGQGAG